MKQEKYLSLISLLLLLALILTAVTLPVRAEEEMNTAKKEVIYAVLDENGGCSSLIAVNLFAPEEAGMIIDFGDYESVTRLTGEAEIVQDGERISAEVPAGEWYYEGKLKHVNLPWLLELQFLLDGEEKKPSELSGAEGELTMSLKIKPNPESPEHFRQSFFLQVTMQLETAKVRDLDTNALIQADAGKFTSLSWLVLPESEEELTFKAEVTDFAMAGPQIAGLPLRLDPAKLNIDEEEIAGALQESGSLDSLKAMEDAVHGFDEGAGKLKESSDEIQAAISAIDQGLSEMASSEEQLKAMEPLMAGFPELKKMIDGGKQLAEAIAELNKGYGEFHQGLSAYADGMSAFRKGIDEAGEGLPEQLRLALVKLFPPYHPESFVSARNQQIHSVQFVLTWPAIPAANRLKK